MRLLLLALLCSLGLVACSTSAPPVAVLDDSTPSAPPVADAPVETTVPVELHDSLRIDTYAVSGRTAAEVRSNLNRTGPLSVSDGRRFDALTSWSLKWTLKYKHTGGQCALDEATVSLDIVVLLPDLVDSPDLPSRAQTSWQAYREALQSHEMGHVENQRREAAQLQQIFSSYDGAWPNCKELGAALKVEGDAKINAIYASDRAYDDETNHGRLQGAVFP